jgi:hypothetical protein
VGLRAENLVDFTTALGSVTVGIIGTNVQGRVLVLASCVVGISARRQPCLAWGYDLEFFIIEDLLW